jgi:ribosomal protein L20
MPIWKIEYFPAKGERNSPIDKLGEICNIAEKAGFQQKIKILGELESQHWNFGWLKQVKGFYQIRQGDFRGYFKLLEKSIVVLHFCRKVAKKAREAELRIAKVNSGKYEKG